MTAQARPIHPASTVSATIALMRIPMKTACVRPGHPFRDQSRDLLLTYEGN
jgi:hypothetical protein